MAPSVFPPERFPFEDDSTKTSAVLADVLVLMPIFINYENLNLSNGFYVIMEKERKIIKVCPYRWR
jgi:hypothetical protein